MMIETYKEELNFIQETIKEAAKLISTTKQISHKDSFDLVTDVDITIERFLADKIRTKYPRDKILGEELNTNDSWEGRVWTIDPIDGTVNFANKIRIYGIQCSLCVDGDIQLGIIYLPVSERLYWALKGKGSFCNGQPIHTSAITTLQDALVSLGDFSHQNAQWYEQQLQLLQTLPDKVAKVRIFGAACYDFAMLASGATSAHIMFTTNAWDIYPGLIITQEAGGVATNLSGEPYAISDGCLLIAANEQISQKILRFCR